MFDHGLLRVHKIEAKSICIGNLSVGGTGKTPMTIYLSNLLKTEHHVNIVSRGYKRKTKGLLKVENNSNYEQYGDEPSQYKHRFKNDIEVYVSERRIFAVNKIEKDKTEQKIILLDDAFQHRNVLAGLNVLMTNYNNLFVDDFVLPMGRLREPKKSAKRAHIIVVNNCPNEIVETEREYILSRMANYCDKLFFSKYILNDPVPFGNTKKLASNLLVVTGIAHPEYLHATLKNSFTIEVIVFKDHHRFCEEDIQKIHEKINNFAGDWSIVTTEKDFMRVKDNLKEWNLTNFPWFYLPIDLKIEKEKEFNEIVINYARKV